MMLDRINDLTWQARQGSVTAIIQVLNEKLANSGVRTRAVFANGVLQLLCEARTADKLEQTILVVQIKQILELIAPRNLHRVNINSRIVREQQLLWLEEITNDPENQLLWSEEIRLEKPKLFQQIIEGLKEKKANLHKLNLSKPQSSFPRIIHKNQTKNKLKKLILSRIFFTLSICLVLFILSWVTYILFHANLRNSLILEPQTSLPPDKKSSVITTPAKHPNQPVNSEQIASSSKEDSFVVAVRIANQASAAGKKAKTSTQWLEIAANWQRASDLMSQVSPQNIRYKEAQIRTKLYQEYSKSAQQEAQKNKL